MTLFPLLILLSFQGVHFIPLTTPHFRDFRPKIRTIKWNPNVLVFLKRVHQSAQRVSVLRNSALKAGRAVSLQHIFAKINRAMCLHFTNLLFFVFFFFYGSRKVNNLKPYLSSLLSLKLNDLGVIPKLLMAVDRAFAFAFGSGSCGIMTRRRLCLLSIGFKNWGISSDIPQF